MKKFNVTAEPSKKWSTCKDDNKFYNKKYFEIGRKISEENVRRAKNIIKGNEIFNKNLKKEKFTKENTN